MSSEQDRIQAVAERVARRLAKDVESGTSDSADGATVEHGLAALRSELAGIRQKLAQIESSITRNGTGVEDHQAVRMTQGDAESHEERSEGRDRRERFSATERRVPLSSSTYIPVVVAAKQAGHPSAERFEVGEAVAELVSFFEREEICRIEPGGKPCDHCAMCSTRGF